jgi:hypothetical protein
VFSLNPCTALALENPQSTELVTKMAANQIASRSARPTIRVSPRIDDFIVSRASYLLCPQVANNAGIPFRILKLGASLMFGAWDLQLPLGFHHQKRILVR